MSKRLAFACFMASLLFLGALCRAERPAKLLVALPDCCNTPDGMSLQPDGSFIISTPNFNDMTAPPRLMKITADNKAEVFYDKLPAIPETGRCGPMGICRAPNGDLYLADMQYTLGKDGKNLLNKSRMLRIVVKDGKPVETLVVASGFNVANGTAIKGDYVYITESVLEEGSHPLISAVMRFKLDELNVQLKLPLKDDPHVIATFKSEKNDWRFGADGIAFDSKGNLFIGLFGEGQIWKIEFDKDGNVASNKLFASASFMKNCDGMSCDFRTDKLYVADSAANAIRIISPDGNVGTLAVNGEPADKRTGELDQPCEALVRGDTIVVSNMDWPFPGFVNTKHHQPATISVIQIPKD